MGWVGRSLGDFGSQVGVGRDIAQDYRARQQQMAMEQARQKLADLMGPLQLADLQQKIKQASVPQFEGTANLPGGGVGAIQRDPNTGAITMPNLVPPTVTREAVNRQITQARATLRPNEFPYIDSLLNEVNTMGVDPSKVLDKFETYIGRADRTSAGDEPLGPRVPQLNSALTARYQVLNPHKDLPSFFALPPNATQKDFDNIDKILQATEMASAKGEEQAGKLSPEAVEAVADIYMKTGQLPPLGMGGVALREQIFNRVGQILSGKGKPPSDIGDPLIARQAAFKALQSSLTQLQRQRSAVGAFENTALKNLEMFKRVAQKVVDTGSPWINKPLRLVERQGLGNEDLAALNAARQVALTEISRVVNNPNLSGVLSDQARGETGALIGDDATLKMILRASDILTQDMANRRNGLDKEIANVSDQIVNGTKPQPTQTQPSAATKPPNATHTGVSNLDKKTYWLDKDGKKLGLAQ